MVTEEVRFATEDAKDTKEEHSLSVLCILCGQTSLRTPIAATAATKTPYNDRNYELNGSSAAPGSVL